MARSRPGLQDLSLAGRDPVFGDVAAPGFRV